MNSRLRFVALFAVGLVLVASTVPAEVEQRKVNNGNVILDVHDLDIPDPAGLEAELNQITGVVTNGLFARRPADTLLVGTDTGVDQLE